MSSGTRYWSKMWPKVAQIGATAVFTLRDPSQSTSKGTNVFGLLL